MVSAVVVNEVTVTGVAYLFLVLPSSLIEQLVTIAVKVSWSTTISFVHPPGQDVTVSIMVAVVEFLLIVTVLLLIATECSVIIVSRAEEVIVLCREVVVVVLLLLIDGMLEASWLEDIEEEVDATDEPSAIESGVEDVDEGVLEGMEGR